MKSDGVDSVESGPRASAKRVSNEAILARFSESDIVDAVLLI